MVCKKGFLHELCSKKCDFKKTMKRAKPEDVKAVVELATNILSKKIPLKKRHIKIVLANRRMLRHLVHPSYSIQSKRRYLIQRGGGFASIMNSVGKIANRVLPIIAKATAKAPIVLKSAQAIAKETAKAAAKPQNIHIHRLKRIGHVAAKPFKWAWRYPSRHSDPRWRHHRMTAGSRWGCQCQQ